MQQILSVYFPKIHSSTLKVFANYLTYIVRPTNTKYLSDYWWAIVVFLFLITENGGNKLEEQYTDLLKNKISYLETHAFGRGMGWVG